MVLKIFCQNDLELKHNKICISYKYFTHHPKIKIKETTEKSEDENKIRMKKKNVIEYIRNNIFKNYIQYRRRWHIGNSLYKFNFVFIFVMREKKNEQNKKK